MKEFKTSAIIDRKKPGLFYCTILPAIIFIVSMAVFFWIAHEVVLEHEDWFDSSAFRFFHNYATPIDVVIFEAFTFLGSATFLLFAYTVSIVFLLLKKRKRDAFAFAILGVSGFMLMFLLKLFYARHRPEDPLLKALENFSFPSGHALGSLVFCSSIAWEIWHSGVKKTWKWVFVFLLAVVTLLIGISRIVLRYHYASDVVGGFSIGLALINLFFFVYCRLVKKSPG